MDSLFEGFPSFQTWVPSECIAVCCGFTDFTIIDCDSLDNGFDGWEDEWEDDWNNEWDNGCDCEVTDSIGICITVTLPDSLVEILGGVFEKTILLIHGFQVNVMQYVMDSRTILLSIVI